ncbi:uncharacterized protein N7482_008882 [Penicillium canariense]|uniref:Uncharacterized protein n=1 Tax=Penicillium canariense TaxID=189055 RepID=A0A9W9LJ65_9EURO|nr:uncharacterized protein N7482_008882 [Penicillium canariense]KAJ5157782.1 hypothetical protein N7482_008882 [Penicillium canariense]
MPDEPENMRGTRDSARHPEQDAPATNTNTSAPGKVASTSDNGTPSLANRVQSSAAGLARSAFQGTDSSDTARTLAGATGGKAAGPSTLGSGASNLASHDIAASRGLGTGAAYAGPGAADSFRSETASSAPGGFELPALSEEDFLRSGAYTDEHSLQLGSEHRNAHSNTSLGDLQGETGNWKGKQRAHDPVQRNYTSAWERADNSGSQAHTYEAQPSDGAAVVSLLADTSFDPGSGGNEELDLDPAAAPPPLTASEIKMLDSFRRQIDASSDGHTQHQQPRLSSLSLVPDIDTFLQQNDPSAFTPGTDTRANSATTLRDTVLDNLPGAGDWVTVHERYHDEVWGYLRPALEAAKAEMEEKGPEVQNGEENDGPAVRRLKMILKHMRA